MIFNLLKSRRDETVDTGTYPDGAFTLPIIDLKAAPSRLRGHIAHERDYGANRSVVQFPAGMA
ncbi:hypothetical protein [Pararhizobium sp.]|uniref:hypothetical protein n=1 Tax=Pararhizobium sp. TaxID=1977563 RepID=UPI002715FC02|nr:hypothetical protein [Pararhizobium sp.]MDO9415583.1 hypothetical protein [Pararhizobium sp.]